MKTQYENRVISSFLLWFDHTLLEKGEAFTNHSSKYYPVDGAYYGYTAYGAPFKQFVTDSSITSATVADGVYVSGVAPANFKETGEYPLVDINYDEGQVYFSGSIASDAVVSGSYAIKDFNVYLTSKAEQEILFEEKINLRPSTIQTETGLASDVVTYPAVFIKNNGGENQPWAFGGEDATKTSLRALVLADSQFNLDALCSIFKDQVRTEVSVLPDEKYPFNALGGLKTGVYDYTDLISEIRDKVYLKNIEVSRFSLGYMENLSNTNPDVFKAMIDFELESYRFPRAS
ncbi:hypothetical protein CL634_11440 [bacterium]|nr:hypothetical protein [bacterium]